MSFKERVYEILDEVKNDFEKAAGKVYNEPKDVVLYVLQIGVEHLAARRRATNRRNLRSAVVNPKFVTKHKGAASYVKLSKKSEINLLKATQTLFDDWKIDAHISLGNATREELLEKASAERASAKGHLRNAEFYERLAEPMQPGQRVRDYWTSPKTVELIRKEIVENTMDSDIGFIAAE